MPIRFSDVFYTYNPKTPLASEALNGINLEIEDGSFTALVGRTGCGKSTLVQHINALLNPSKGEVVVDEFVNCADKKKRSKKLYQVRRKVGLVFQFPEYQLFEENVEKDVAFAPNNFGASKEEALKAAHEALLKVGLDESFYKRSPFELSGGEKRRVAIAGILAFHPDVLVVDEPTAGLDPRGAAEMMELFESVHREGTTVILVTHDMNLVLQYCDKVIVLDHGKIAKISNPVSLFQEDIEAYSLETPLIYAFMKKLKARGMDIELKDAKDPESLAKLLAEAKRRKV
ncbi:MAG: energy-coupling factor transporter ATPase [Bacilli bacterium]|nr:energy-coupling factor transporter ATPase [Bacilli bacterium]